MKSILAVFGAITLVALVIGFLASANSPDSSRRPEQPQSDDLGTPTYKSSDEPAVFAPAAPLPPLVGPDVYHSIDASVMTCDDPQTTTAIQYASDHPGAVSDKLYDALWYQGNCSPISEEVRFRVTRLFELRLAAGIARIAEATMRYPDESDHTFYILQNRMVKAPTVAKPDSNADSP